MTYITFSYAAKWIFFALWMLGLGGFLWVLWRRLRLILLGAPDERFDAPLERLRRMWRLPPRRLLREKVPGLWHTLLVLGAAVFFIRALQMMAVVFAGSSALFYFLPFVGPVVGTLFQTLKELALLGVWIGMFGFACRRLLPKPARREAQAVGAWVASAWIALLMLADILLEAGWHAFVLTNGVELHGLFPVPSLGWLISPLLTSDSGYKLFKAMVWTYGLLALGFLVYLPFGSAFHALTALPNAFFARRSPRLARLENLEATSVGVRHVDDLTWKQRLDLYACADCGRCEANCPAFASGKPLSVRRINREAKAQLYARASYLLGRTPPPESAPVMSPEAAWACTLCGDCEERCPTFVEQVPRLVEVRRRLVMSDHQAPAAVTELLGHFARSGNPWGLRAEARGEEWRSELGVTTLAENADVEYLFYVGCMGAFDARSQQVVKAAFKLLKAAKVSFGVLGAEEVCCGETARRLGDERLGAQLTQANLAVFAKYGVKRILTFCPHCDHALRHDYAAFGAAFAEVRHVTELLDACVQRGTLTIPRAETRSVTYHDACRLGRDSGLYVPPRRLLTAAGLDVVEPERTRERSFCCGAGGGLYWMGEAAEGASALRLEELRAAGAATIGVSCPYCLASLQRAARAPRLDGVPIRDILEILAERLPSAEA